MSPKKDPSSHDCDAESKMKAMAPTTNKARATKMTASNASPTTAMASATSVSPKNPFDSPVEDEKIAKTPVAEETERDEGRPAPSSKPKNTPVPASGAKSNAPFGAEVSPVNPFDTPVNSFDTPDSSEGESVGMDIALEEGGGGDHAALSESRRRLDDVFQNESIVICSRSVDRKKSTHHQNSIRHQNAQGHESPENTEGCEEGAIEVNEFCDKDNDDDVRRTTLTKGESMLWEDGSSHYDGEGGRGDDDHDEESFWENRFCCCLLVLFHRVCNPHIHPPCLSNLTHPHLPRCLERIPPRTRQIICRTLIISFMVVTITFTCLDLLILHKYLHVWLDSTLAWLVSNPVSGGVAFVGIFLLASLCFFPVGLLSLGAGFAYIELYGLGLGIVVAFLVCYLGCLVGSAVCFARSRYLMRRLVERFSVKYPIVRSVDRAFETMGFRLFLLLRLSPAMPFNALNYIGGITAISFRNYWWATCTGIAPNILWTIFVGATFGTVNARGVDGNEEFDQNSVRKGVVLGLGIGLGVMGIVGTGIYARKELTRIVIAEQRERAAEEQLGAEMSQHLMNGECEAIPEEGDDCSLSVADLENPQQGENARDFDGSTSYGRNASASSSATHRFNGDASYGRSVSGASSATNRTDYSTPSGRRGYTTQRSWTPEAVAAELPILPKVLYRYLSPIISVETVESSLLETEGNVEMSLSVASSDDDSVRKKVHLSASMPSLAGQNDFAADPDEVETASPATSPQNHSYDNVKTASSPLAPTDKHNRPRACSAPLSPIAPTDEENATGLRYIDETRVLSDDDSPPKEGDSIQMMTPINVSRGQGNRRRSISDPTDKGEHHSSASAITANANDDESDCARGRSATPSSRKRRQRSPLWTPMKKDLRRGRSHNDLSRYGRSPSPHRSPHRHQTSNEQRQQQHENGYARSSSLDARRDGGSPLPFEFSPSHNHLELNINDNDAADEEEEGPSREWFWIWS